MGEGGHKIGSRLPRCGLMLQKSLVHFITMTLATDESRVFADPLQLSPAVRKPFVNLLRCKLFVIVCHGYLKKNSSC